jgi:hypothetical protein
MTGSLVALATTGLMEALVQIRFGPVKVTIRFSRLGTVMLYFLTEVQHQVPSKSSWKRLALT